MDLHELCQEWHTLKLVEQATAEKRRRIEEQILDLQSIDAAKPGTVTVANMLKVQCGVTRKVDTQQALSIAAQKKLNPADFFVMELRPIAAAHKELGDDNPFLRAMESKPSKPSFSIKIGDKK